MLLTMAVLSGAATEADAKPISLHPANPHYFLFRGKPTVLVSSAEHYGAVLNLDFDYVKYLDTLQKDRLNQTRLFSGAYVEDPSAFNIQRNTLAPKPERFLCPWARSGTPGYAGGASGKFDLTQWDADYFTRLKDYIRQAGRRGVVVELVLFCPFYEDSMWARSPMNAANNVNGVGQNVKREEVYTLKHADLTRVQDEMTRKIVNELRGFDNLYYEICNEAYFGGVTREWQDHIARVIVETEKGFRDKHLIAQNVANGAARYENPNPAVSIVNFHYAAPPDAVTLNYDLNLPIAFDETGFKGNADATYRVQAWDFLLAGGAVFSNLDYSFAVGHEDGTFAYPPTQPGGGNVAFRKQMGVLHEFMTRLDFVRMVPDADAVKVSAPAQARALRQGDRTLAVYVHGGTQADLTLQLHAGRWRAEWIKAKTGTTERTETLNHDGGALTLASPSYEEDIALRLTREQG